MEQKGNAIMWEQLSLFENHVDIDALINALLHIGSCFAYSKTRIYDHFTDNHKLDDNAAFLKHEYGIGGRSWRFDGNDLFVDYNWKGIQCYSFGIDTSAKIDISLNWHQAAKKIRSSIDSGEYITKEQYDALRKKEKEEHEYWKRQGLED